MKLAKKLLANRVNSVRPYKSRSKRPCDFCRRRKTCCIIENLIPCMACALFNKGTCTFLEGPLKRRNRNLSEPRVKRGRKRNLESSPNLSPELMSGDHGYVLSLADLSPHESMTPLSGGVQPHLRYFGQYDMGQVLEHHQGETANMGPTHPLSTGALSQGSVQGETTGVWQESAYMRDIRYPDMMSGYNHGAGRVEQPDVQLRQLTLSLLSTLSSALFWLDALPGYDTLLNMLNEYGDFDTKKQPVMYAAQSYFQPQHGYVQPQTTMHQQQQQQQQQLQLAQGYADHLLVLIPGWNYSEYAGGLASGISEALTLQGTLTSGHSNFSPTEPLRELLA